VPRSSIATKPASFSRPRPGKNSRDSFWPSWPTATLATSLRQISSPQQPRDFDGPFWPRNDKRALVRTSLRLNVGSRLLKFWGPPSWALFMRAEARRTPPFQHSPIDWRPVSPIAFSKIPTYRTNRVFVGSSISEPLLLGGMFLSALRYMIFLQPIMALLTFLLFVPLIQQAINRRVIKRFSTLRAISAVLTACRNNGCNVPSHSVSGSTNCLR
jgi:hypothetical protein